MEKKEYKAPKYEIVRFDAEVLTVWRWASGCSGIVMFNTNAQLSWTCNGPEAPGEPEEGDKPVFFANEDTENFVNW